MVDIASVVFLSITSKGARGIVNFNAPLPCCHCSQRPPA
jgi:hypothetical protein